MTKYDVIAYTDGACKGNPGIGGWGVVLECHATTRELCGGAKATTNNRMELTAAIRALEECPESVESVLIYTDSQYVQKGIYEWLPNWKKNGWKNAKGGAVKNKDLWQQLADLCDQFEVTWMWVKGHNDNPGNCRADQLANKGIRLVR